MRGSAEEPGVARLAYRKLKSAAGVADLADLESRLDRLEVGVAEDRDLQEPLAQVLDRTEGSLVPLLEARHPDCAPKMIPEV